MRLVFIVILLIFTSCGDDKEESQVWISEGKSGETELNYNDSNDQTMGVLVGEYISTETNPEILESLRMELENPKDFLTKDDISTMMKAKYFVIYDGLDLPLDTVYLKDKEEQE